MSRRPRCVHASAIVASLCVALATPTRAQAQEPTAPAPSPAPATPPAAAELGDDEVLLRGGGFVRGTVIEVLPDVRAVIVVSGVRTEIPWDDIVEVQRGRHATGPVVTPAVPTETTTAFPSDAEADVGRPRIHLEPTRPRPVTLFEIDSEIIAGGYGTSMYGMNYRSVCVAPCDVVVDGSRGQQFFLGSGDGAMWTASRKFTLADQQGPLTIRVKPGSRALRIVGAIVLGIGIGGTVGGTVLTIQKNTRTPGLIMLAVSVPALVAGIPMLVFGRTRYELGDRLPTGDRGPADGP